MKILGIFLGAHHKIGVYLVFISMHFRVFSLGQGTESGTVDAGPVPTYAEKMRVPPPPPLGI